MDTVKLWQDGRGVKKLPNALSGIKETKTDKGGHYITGNLDNMYITISNDGVSFNGSLCKYIHGNSLVNMTRQDTQFAVQKLEDEMQFLMGGCKTTRLDFGYSLQLDEPPINYLRLMDYLPLHTKLVQPNSVYFQNGMRKILLYDKIIEMKGKKQPIPLSHQNKYFIKAEVSYTRLTKHFNKTITASDLYNEDFFLMLQTEWKNQLMAINRMKSTTPTTSKMTADQFKDYLFAKYIQENGMNEVLNEINENKDKFSNEQAVKRIRDSVRKSKHLIQNNPLVMELDNKIMNFDMGTESVPNSTLLY